jgi:hypothetical protein
MLAAKVFIVKFVAYMRYADPVSLLELFRGSLNN